MTGDEDQLTRRGSLGAPLQKVVGVQRLTVLFIDTEKRHVQIVTRVSEVIRIAPKKSRLLLRRKDQANVGIGLVLVEPVLAALVERNHIGAEFGLFLALLFNCGNLRIARLQSLLFVRA